MGPRGLFISFYTILRKDVVRIIRIWPQTLLPSVVTSVLYFVIFGGLLGPRIGEIEGAAYISFVIPGLVMLAVVTNSFTNVATIFFTSKFFARNIDEILVSPTPPWVIIAGYVSTGIIRGVTIGVLVILVSLFFSSLTIYNLPTVIAFLFLTSLVFSLAGLINGIYAKSFDGVTIVPTFVLTPLVYLGGVFYSASMLPPFWQTTLYANPIFYVINGFRQGLLGFSDISLGVSFTVLFAFIGILTAISWYQLAKGLGLKQ